MEPLRTTHERREDDIYDYEYRLKSGLDLLDRTTTISVEDKALIKDFLTHLKANGASTGRLAKYLFHLKNLGAHLGVTFREAKRADIERLVSWLTDQDYTPHTVSDYAFALKRFYKFVRFGNVDPETPYPDEVRWVRRGLKASERTLPDFVTEEQIISLVSAADKLRDKAMLSVGYEGGFRASELLLMNIGNVTLDERGARVKVRGKTGERRLGLISSAPILGEYLDVHPLRDNPSATLLLLPILQSWQSISANIGCARVVPLFLDKSGKLDEVQQVAFDHERQLQDITEGNLREIFGLNFVKREFSIGQLRIDTLAYDEQMQAFVIIEYKKDRNSSVIDQGYAYLSLLLNNKADFILEYNESQSKHLKRDEINWDQSRVIFVSPEFTKYQRQAISFKDLPFELWEVKKYENGLIDYLKLESPESAESITKVSGKSKVVEEVNKEIKVYSEETHLTGKPEPIIKKYRVLSDKIMALGSNVTLKPTKIYVAYLSPSNFASIEITPGRLKLWINLKIGELADPKKLARDVSSKGHHGVGDYEIDILPNDDLEYRMYLIKQSFDKHSR